MSKTKTVDAIAAIDAEGKWVVYGFTEDLGNQIAFYRVCVVLEKPEPLAALPLIGVATPIAEGDKGEPR